MGIRRIFGYFSLLRVYLYIYITRDNTKYSQLFAIPSKKERLWNTFTDCVMMIISVAEHWEGPEQYVLTLCITVMKQSQHQQELEPGMVWSHLSTLWNQDLKNATSETELTQHAFKPATSQTDSLKPHRVTGTPEQENRFYDWCLDLFILSDLRLSSEAGIVFKFVK